MNLFKKDPQLFFQIVSAVFLVVLAVYLGLLINYNYSDKLYYKDVEKAASIPTSTNILHIKLKSPSYAMSNFDIDPATKIEVYLQEPVVEEEFSQSVKLINKNTNEEIPLSYAKEDRSKSEYGLGSTFWERKWRQKYIFIPGDTLADKSPYSFLIAPRYHVINSSQLVRSEYKYDFMTTDIFGILSTNFDSDEPFPIGNKIKIVFTSPLDYQSLADTIVIKPFISDLDLQVTDKILTINNSLEPDTQYTITFPQITHDLYGRKLGETLIYRFTTSK